MLTMSAFLDFIASLIGRVCAGSALARIRQYGHELYRCLPGMVGHRRETLTKKAPWFSVFKIQKLMGLRIGGFPVCQR